MVVSVFLSELIRKKNLIFLTIISSWKMIWVFFKHILRNTRVRQILILSSALHFIWQKAVAMTKYQLFLQKLPVVLVLLFVALCISTHFNSITWQTIQKIKTSATCNWTLIITKRYFVHPTVYITTYNLLLSTYLLYVVLCTTWAVLGAFNSPFSVTRSNLG